MSLGLLRSLLFSVLAWLLLLSPALNSFVIVTPLSLLTDSLVRPSCTQTLYHTLSVALMQGLSDVLRVFALHRILVVASHHGRCCLAMAKVVSSSSFSSFIFELFPRFARLGLIKTSCPHQ